MEIEIEVEVKVARHQLTFPDPMFAIASAPEDRMKEVSSGTHN